MMTEIAYLLLCHKDPDAVVAQAETLTARGDKMVIHVDARMPAPDFQRVKTRLSENASVRFAKRVRCGWGEWSLVQASLNMIEEAVRAFPEATHFYMISGDCAPIKPAHYIHSVLEETQKDFIENADFFGDWIKVGPKEDRLIYRHWFNERENKWLFYESMKMQRRLGMQRAIPPELAMRIGSQWWCLRRSTVEALLGHLRKNPHLIKFFRTTWIPDEIFFQTLVPHLVPRREIVSRSPTFLAFSDYGMPAVFYPDHEDMLKSQDQLFARKISGHRSTLRDALSGYFLSDEPVATETLTRTGLPIYHYMTVRGRDGGRFGARAWEQGSRIAPGHELRIVACKKWHVGKRFLEAIAAETDLPSAGYVFHDPEANLPALGGLEQGLKKRQQHRRAFTRLLMEALGRDTLLLGIDSSADHILRDLKQGGAAIRVLEIDCEISDEYLRGHAQRVGLGGAEHGAQMQQTILGALRRDFTIEQERLRATDPANTTLLTQGGNWGQNRAAMMKFLDIDIPAAERLLHTPNLFDD
ncbi:DUF5928 domain-containing protein [Paracoccaceae bacterium GXU_MW_L88]